MERKITYFYPGHALIIHKISQSKAKANTGSCVRSTENCFPGNKTGRCISTGTRLPTAGRGSGQGRIRERTSDDPPRISGRRLVLKLRRGGAGCARNLRMPRGSQQHQSRMRTYGCSLVGWRSRFEEGN